MSQTRFKDQQKQFVEMINRFKCDTPQHDTIKREVYHTLSPYKRAVDEYRNEINAMGVYNDNEFDSIFFYRLDRTVSVAFVIADREGALIIKVGLITPNTPQPNSETITMTYDNYKAAINGFNREVREMGYKGFKNRYSLIKFKEIFLKHFNKDKAEQTNFKIEYAKSILEKSITDEAIALKKAKRAYNTKSNKLIKANQEFREKVRAYEKELKKELKIDKLTKDTKKAQSNLHDKNEEVLNKLKETYSNDTRFTMSFSFEAVRKAFRELLNH